MTTTCDLKAHPGDCQSPTGDIESQPGDIESHRGDCPSQPGDIESPRSDWQSPAVHVLSHPVHVESPAVHLESPMPDRFRPARVLLPLLALFLCVLGARLWLIQTYGNATPYWDQWDAEAATVLKPWREGWITPGHFWAPHAEHRIVFTRLETIGLTQLNGQWDPLVEMVFNAGLAAVVALGLAAFLGRAFPPGSRMRTLAAPGLAAAMFALPFAWENTLAGFQGQFFFLLGFTLAALAGLGLGRPGSAGWWAGAAAALAACFSMGSGFTAAGVVLGWLGLRMLRERRWRPARGEWATAAVCLAVTIFGLAIRYDPPAHAPLKAENLAAWVRAFGRCLAWPRVKEPGWGLVMWLPWLGLALMWFWQRRQVGRVTPNAPTDGALDAQPDGGLGTSRPTFLPDALVLLGTWLLVQCAAMAYARGANNEPPVSRYFDLLALGAVVNVLAVVWLAGRAISAGSRWERNWRGWTVVAASVGWAGLLAWGVVNLVRVDLDDEMPTKRARSRAQETNVRAYVATGDKAHLLNKGYLDLPYPNPDRLATLLDDPTVRALLPANVRAPLRLSGANPSSAASSAFAPGHLPPGTPAAVEPAPGRPAVGSFDPGNGAVATGELRAALVPAPTLPYLRWEAAAGGEHGGDSQLLLAARDARTGESATLDTRHLPSGDRWRVEHVALPGPAGALVDVVAADRTPAGWLAFREPTEEGALSYWSGWLTRRAAWVFAAGVGLAALASFGTLLRDRRRHVERVG